MSAPPGSWRASSHSFSDGNCVQVARLPGEVAVRDSKDPRGPALRFTLTEWAQFLASLRRGSGAGRLSLPDGRLDLPPLSARERAAHRLPPAFVDPPSAWAR